MLYLLRSSWTIYVHILVFFSFCGMTQWGGLWKLYISDDYWLSRNTHSFHGFMAEWYCVCRLLSAEGCLIEPGSSLEGSDEIFFGRHGYHKPWFLTPPSLGHSLLHAVNLSLTFSFEYHSFVLQLTHAKKGFSNRRRTFQPSCSHCPWCVYHWNMINEVHHLLYVFLKHLIVPRIIEYYLLFSGHGMYGTLAEWRLIMLTEFWHVFIRFFSLRACW